MSKMILIDEAKLSSVLEVMQNQGDVSVDEWIAAEKALREALAEQPAQQALDKMAENARELGLDYEPAQEKDQSVMYTYPSKPEPIPCGKPMGILMKQKSDEHMKLYPLAEQPAQQQPAPANLWLYWKVDDKCVVTGPFKTHSKDEAYGLDCIDQIPLTVAAPQPAQQDEFKAAYIEAMVASNEAGFAGMSAAETIRELSRMVAEQPARQEPVGRLESDPDEGHVFVPRIDGDWSMLGEDLYTSPQPAQQQEPIAYAVYHRMGGSKSLHWPEQHSPDGDASQYQLVPLCTSSQAERPWVGLTKHEFNECVDGLEDLEDCWTVIEAKLKEKNT